MDPVSVFLALYDSKCIKFGQYDLKSGLVAPYYINLRRLPLYPKLMDAIVNQVVEKFLSPQALGFVMTQIRRQQMRQQSLDSGVGSLDQQELKISSAASQESDADSHLEDDIETCSDEGCDDRQVQHSHLSFRPIISGVPYGAVPLAATIAYKAQLPFLLERKDTKSYGDQQSLVDDYINEPAAPDDQQGDADKQAKQQKQKSVILIEDVICSGESTLEAVRRVERLGLKVEFVICIVDREENGTNLLLEQQGIKVFSLYNMIAILRVLEATGRIAPGLFMSTRQWIVQNQFEQIGVDPSISARKCIAKQPADSTIVAGQLDMGAIEVVSN